MNTVRKNWLWIVVGSLIIAVTAAIFFYLSRVGVISFTNITTPGSRLKADQTEIKMTAEEGSRSSSEFKLENTGNTGTEKASFVINKSSSEDQSQSNKSPDWLSFTPSNGDIGVGESQKIKVTATALDLEPGSYQAYLQISERSKEKIITLPVRLIVVSAPLIDLTRIEISDGQTNNTWGNSNRVANPGERISLTVFLENKGKAKARGVKVKLVSADETATIVGNPVVSVGAVKGVGTDQTKSNRFSVTFIVDISNSADPSLPPIVNLTTRDEKGRKWLENFYLGKEGAFKYPTGLKKSKND